MKIRNSFGFICLALIGNASAQIYVTRSEVPTPPTCTSFSRCTTVIKYIRHDGAPVITSQGTIQQDTTKSTTTVDCDNCPDKYSSLTCGKSVSNTQTETINHSINGSVTAGIPGLEASLGATVGSSAGNSVTFQQVCSTTVPPGVHSVIELYHNITVLKTATITHTYHSVCSYTGLLCGHDEIYSHAGGTRTSTSTGSYGNNNGGCRSQPNIPCPTTGTGE